VTDVYENLEELYDLLTELSTRVERHENLYVRMDYLEERIEEIEKMIQSDVEELERIMEAWTEELEAFMHAERN